MSPALLICSVLLESEPGLMLIFTRLLLPLSWPKRKKIWLRQTWKSDPKAVLKPVTLNWGFQYGEFRIVNSHLQLSEAFLLKDVCYSLTFSHIFSISTHHQGGCRQLWMRGRRDKESSAPGGAAVAAKLHLLTRDKGHSCKFWQEESPVQALERQPLWCALFLKGRHGSPCSKDVGCPRRAISHSTRGPGWLCSALHG